MSENTVCDPTRRDEAEFGELLQAHCPEMHVLTGTYGASSNGERIRSEIVIVIPGERAVAEIMQRAPDGGPRRQMLSERQISLIPPGQTHELSCPARTELTMLRIEPELLRRIARESGMRAVELIGQCSAFDPIIWHLGRALRDELRRRRQLDAQYLQSVAVVLTRHLLSTYVTTVLPAESGGLPRYKLRRTVEYIHENLGGEISFRNVAAHVRMSPYHFARKFKQSTGQSPHNYIVQCRIERAKVLLAEARLPICDVAFEVGYKSQSHFTTCFGRVTGVTPGEFRAGR